MSTNKTFKEFTDQNFPSVEDCLADYYLNFRTDTKLDKDNIIVSILSTSNTMSIDLSDYTALGYEQINPDWIYTWIKEKGFVEYNHNYFVLTDSKNIPTARICLHTPIKTSAHFHLIGSKELVAEFIKYSVPYFKPIEYKDDVLESIELQGFTERGPQFKTRELPHMYDLHNEFYPYLDGGFEELIRDFLLSEESVLILGGTPGTGKTAGIRETCIKLGLRPIVAQDAHALAHPNFVNTIFDMHAKMFEESNGTKEEEYVCEPYEEMHKDVLIKNYLPKVQRVKKKDKTSVGRGYTAHFLTLEQVPSGYVGGLTDNHRTDIEVEGPGLPIIFVEDADDVLAKLKDGNKLMQNLRNRTDGFSKSDVPTKIIFTTNHETPDFIDEALLRDGRCYGFFPFRKLTPEEAIIARKVAGLPEFEEIPNVPVCLATALRKQRKKIFVDKSTGKFGFTKH